MADEGGGFRGGEGEGSSSEGRLDLEGVATETGSWDLLEDGAKPGKLLQRDVGVLTKPGNEGGEGLKVSRFLFENSQQERLEKAWGSFEGIQVELLASREEWEEAAET